MQKKWMNYGIVAVIICAIVWTIYSNFFLTTNTKNQTIAIGSLDIEIAEEDDIKDDVMTERSETETHNDSGNEIHSHDEHEDAESINDNDSDSDDHLHEINTTEVVDVSNSAPQFITKTLDGETVQLSDFLGKRVILNFWTTWCPPCQEEIPELQEFNETLAVKDDIVLLGLNITNEDLGTDVIHDFRDYYGITYPILLDETGQITESYEIITIPTTYIIDEKGNLEKQILGPLTKDMLNELLIK